MADNKTQRRLSDEEKEDLKRKKDFAALGAAVRAAELQKTIATMPKGLKKMSAILGGATNDITSEMGRAYVAGLTSLINSLEQLPPRLWRNALTEVESIVSFAESDELLSDEDAQKIKAVGRELSKEIERQSSFSIRAGNVVASGVKKLGVSALERGAGYYGKGGMLVRGLSKLALFGIERRRETREAGSSFSISRASALSSTESARNTAVRYGSESVDDMSPSRFGGRGNVEVEQLGELKKINSTLVRQIKVAQDIDAGEDKEDALRESRAAFTGQEAALEAPSRRQVTALMAQPAAKEGGFFSSLLNSFGGLAGMTAILPEVFEILSGAAIVFTAWKLMPEGLKTVLGKIANKLTGGAFDTKDNTSQGTQPTQDKDQTTTNTVVPPDESWRSLQREAEPYGYGLRAAANPIRTAKSLYGAGANVVAQSSKLKGMRLGFGGGSPTTLGSLTSELEPLTGNQVTSYLAKKSLTGVADPAMEARILQFNNAGKAIEAAKTPVQFVSGAGKEASFLERVAASRLGKFGVGAGEYFAKSPTLARLAKVSRVAGKSIGYLGAGMDAYDAYKSGFSLRGGLKGLSTGLQIAGLVGAPETVGASLALSALGTGLSMATDYFLPEPGSKPSEKAATSTTPTKTTSALPSNVSSELTPAQLTEEQMNALLDAQTRWEGGKPGDRNMRNNNPGNIRRGKDDFAGKHGGIGYDEGGYALFPSKEVGRAAQRALWLSPTYRNRPLTEAIHRWAPDASPGYTSALLSSVGAPASSVAALSSTPSYTRSAPGSNAGGMSGGQSIIYNAPVTNTTVVGGQGTPAPTVIPMPIRTEPIENTLLAITRLNYV
jgi:hypothetical protein